MSKQAERMDVVIVRWVDSSLQNGWQNLSELKKEWAEIVSAGILVKKDKRVVVLIQSYDEGNECFAEGLVIPRCAVRGIEKIAEVKKYND